MAIIKFNLISPINQESNKMIRAHIYQQITPTDESILGSVICKHENHRHNENKHKQQKERTIFMSIMVFMIFNS